MKKTFFKNIFLILLLIIIACICFFTAYSEKENVIISSGGNITSNGPLPVFKYFLYLGDWSLLMLASAFTILLQKGKDRYDIAFPLTVTTFCGCLSSEFLVCILEYAFPNIKGITNINGISFPSVPVMNSTVFFGAVFVFVLYKMKNTKAKKLILILNVLTVVIVLTGALGSALYDAADVISGLSLGIIPVLILNIFVKKQGEKSDRS